MRVAVVPVPGVSCVRVSAAARSSRGALGVRASTPADVADLSAPVLLEVSRLRVAARLRSASRRVLASCSASIWASHAFHRSTRARIRRSRAARPWTPRPARIRRCFRRGGAGRRGRRRAGASSSARGGEASRGVVPGRGVRVGEGVAVASGARRGRGARARAPPRGSSRRGRGGGRASRARSSSRGSSPRRRRRARGAPARSGAEREGRKRARGRAGGVARGWTRGRAFAERGSVCARAARRRADIARPPGASRADGDSSFTRRNLLRRRGHSRRLNRSGFVFDINRPPSAHRPRRARRRPRTRHGRRRAVRGHLRQQPEREDQEGRCVRVAFARRGEPLRARGSARANSRVARRPPRRAIATLAQARDPRDDGSPAARGVPPPRCRPPPSSPHALSPPPPPPPAPAIRPPSRPSSNHLYDLFLLSADFAVARRGVFSSARSSTSSRRRRTSSADRRGWCSIPSPRRRRRARDERLSFLRQAAA